LSGVIIGVALAFLYRIKRQRQARLKNSE
jgi:hypothetical protein